MRRQALTKHKVISSGRLTAAGRSQTPKKRVAVRSRSSAEPAYSLYSTDSEDQVTIIHKGLDRCAALLNGILQTEKTDAMSSSASVGKAGVATSRPLSTLGKERGQTKSRKQTKTVKKTVPAPVQKILLSSQLNPGVKKKGPIRTSEPSSDTKFNCHLTTSTPTDSPERLPSNSTGNTATRRPSVPPGSSAPLAQQRDPIPGVTPSHQGDAPSTALLASKNGTASHHPVSSADPPISLHTAHPCSSISGGQAAAPGGCGLGRVLPLRVSCTGRPSQSPPLSPHSSKAAQSGPRPPLSRSGACEQQPQPQPYFHSQSHPLSHSLPNDRSHSPPLTRSQSQFFAHTDHSPQSDLQIHTNVQPNLQSVRLVNPNANLRSQTQSDPEIPSPAWTGKGSKSAGSQDGVTSPGAGHREGAVAGDVGENEDRECDDVMPVRDTSAQTSFDQPTPAACTCSNPHAHLGPARAHTRSNAEAPPEQAYTHLPPHPHPLLWTSAEGWNPERMACEVMTVQYLLGELKALLAGKGGVAERLVSDLEQTVSLLPVMVGSTNIQAEIALVLQPLRSENAQLRRRVRILNQQLQGREKAERETRSLHCDTEMTALQVELSDTETQLQHVQLDNAQLRQALEDTQRKLEQSETENSRISMEVEDHGRRLEECQRDRAAWELIAQQRQAEIVRLEQLLRVAQVPPIVESSAMTDTPQSRPVLTRHALDRYQGQQNSLEHDSDPVSQYLKSLDQRGCGPVSPPCKGPPQAAQRKDTLPGQSGLGSNTLPGQSGLGSNTLPGQSGLRPNTLPGQSGLGSNTLPGQSGLGSNTLPGQSGLRPNTLPGQSGLGTNTLSGQSGLGSNTLPGQSVSVSADHDFSVCVPVEKSVCASFDQNWSVTWEGEEDRGTWHRSQGEGGTPDSSPSRLKRLSGILQALHQSKECSSHLNKTNSYSKRLTLSNVPMSSQQHLEIGNAPTPDSRLSSCDVRSLASDWSVGSSSTFDTRDEQEFRNGLAALDASIASLQRTIQQDLRR